MRQTRVRAALTVLWSGLLLMASVVTASAQDSRVIVELRLPSTLTPEANLPNVPAVIGQRQAIADRAAQVLSRLPVRPRPAQRQFATVPFIVLNVNPQERAALAADPDVLRVMDDVLLFPVLSDSVPLVEADQAWNAGYDGSGTVVAILDNGVDKNHPFLAGKVVDEACFSLNVPGETESLCPNGLDQQTGPGSATPCTLSTCFHGTHVAGIIAGNHPSPSPGEPIAGVARGANLLAIQVFVKVLDPNQCGGVAPCTGAHASDVVAALELVYARALGGMPIAAVNMSLGGALFTAPCDSEPYKPGIDNLRAIGVATVVASGNSGVPFAMSTPGCISSAVSVGSTDKNDQVSSFSNVASFLSLFAPGEAITSSVPGGSFAEFSGTSMATPHVTGAWAVLRQAAPGASVTEMLARFRSTGLSITDNRFFGTSTIPRIRLLRALATYVSVTNPVPSISATNPTRGRASGIPLKLQVIGSNFSTFSVVRWNGADRPTRLISTTKLEASIPASDLSAEGVAQVSVHTPGPGGGTTNAIAFTIDPPAALTVSASVVSPGSQVTVTLVRGFGGDSDWLALARTGADEDDYLQWTWVGDGVTDRTWTVTMPDTAGTYEFRLFISSENILAAKSPVVTVDASVNPTPVATSLSPTFAMAGGPAFTLTVNGSKFMSGSVVRWNGASRPTTFVSATQLQAAIGAGDIAAAGSASVTVFSPSPGGGTSATLPFTIRTTPVLAVSSTSVSGGGSVTVTLTNGTGGGGDWIALAGVGTANSTYVQYTYVGAGVTTRTWTVNAPPNPGQYEFRLFENYGYTRLATSPAVTVLAGPVITSLSPAAAGVGGPAFTLTVEGNSFTSGSIVRWNGANRATTFVSTGQLRASIPASDLAAAGTAQITVFDPGTGASSAPRAFPVQTAPTLTVSSTTVTTGSSVTVTLNNGFGGAGDWLALAAVGSPNSSYLQYTYVGSGVTTKTWTVTITSPGSFEFRLLTPGNSRLATSAPITATAGSPPTLTVSSTTVTTGTSVTVTLTGGFGGAGDWISFAAAGSGDSSYLQYTYVGSGVTTRTWTVVATTPGTFEFRLLTGSNQRLATSAPITVSQGAPPALTVSTTTAARGALVTVTLTGGYGGITDWLALAQASSPNTSYIQWTYVGQNVTTTTWTVAMPNTPGTYEFRLFQNSGYTLLAKSPSITVN